MLGFFIPLFMYATQILAPVQKIIVEGVAKDMVLDEGHLYIGTDKGKLQVYDYKEERFRKEIVLPNIEDFTGDSVSSSCIQC